MNTTFLEAAHRLWPYHSLFERLSIPREVKEDYTSHIHFTQKALMDRRSENTSRADFSSFVLNGMTEHELFDNAKVVVMAGGETTATTLSAAIYYLMNNQPSYERLVAEIRGRFTSEVEITLSTLGELKYLRAVIKKTLRIHPAVPIGLHRLVPKKGKFIEGKWVPGGTWVSFANLAACRSSRYWYAPETFAPERWLGNTKYASDNRYAAAPFNIGTRACLGIKYVLKFSTRGCSDNSSGTGLANTNMQLILARPLWNFDLESQPDNVDPHNFQEYGIWKVEPLMVKLVDTEYTNTL